MSEQPIEALPGDSVAESPADEPGSSAHVPSALALTAGLALAACDSGASSNSGGGVVIVAPTPTPTPTPPPVTQVQASRFLAHATMGATKAEIANVVSLGYEGWIDQQFAMARPISHWDWLVENGYTDPVNQIEDFGFEPVMWRQMIASPDQLRQRVGLALHEIMVVGTVSLSYRQFGMAAYIDVLLDNAFGNFRTLLTGIATNVAMARFLTFLGNRKANPNRGSVPDENFARELMQLFTLGLYRLNMDGTRQLSGGQPIVTYEQEDVSQLARVFTGLSYDSNDSSTPDRNRRPLAMYANQHETGASTFLGATIPAGTEGMAAIGLALDTIFAHPNLPPFISTQLIQRLVTSNPSPAYVGRVSAVFANNGAGVRGDMRAIVKAILLDPEARGDAALSSTSAGKLREPVMRLTGWARAFGVTSPSNAWGIGNTSSATTRLAQSMGRSPSVFNFFRPDYTPPSAPIVAAGLVAPEFQITNEQSVLAYINFMHGLIENGIGDVRPNYAEILTKANDAQALIDEINLVLAAGQLSPATVATIRGAVESISASSSADLNNRVYTAILLTMASPEYLTVR